MRAAKRSKCFGCQHAVHPGDEIVQRIYGDWHHDCYPWEKGEGLVVLSFPDIPQPRRTHEVPKL